MNLKDRERESLARLVDLAKQRERLAEQVLALRASDLHIAWLEDARRDRAWAEDALRALDDS